MSDEVDKPSDDESAEQRAEFLAQQKRLAKHIQAQRMLFWLVMAAVPLVVAAIVLIARSVFGFEMTPTTIATLVIGWFVLRISILPNALLESDGAFANEILAMPTVVSRERLVTFLRQNLHSIQFADILMSPLLIFSLAVSLDLLAFDWKSAAVGVGWFAGLGLYALLNQAKRTPPGKKSKGGGLHAIILLFFLPSLLNIWSSPHLDAQDIYVGTSVRLLATIIAMFAIVAFLTVFIWQVEYKLFGALMRVLPARWSLKKRSVKVQNLVAFQEVHLQKEITSNAGASIAVGAILYWLYGQYPSHWVFVIFSMLAVVPSILAMVVISRELPMTGQRYVRRLGLQSAGMTLILVNLLLGLGYCIGWGLTRAYQYMFADFGAFPYPDRFYLFRDIEPGELPFVVQIEALIAAIVVLFAVSWIVYVVQSRAWKEGAFVTVLTGAAAGAPYLDFDALAVLAQYMPSLSGLPQGFLAICIPALKGLFTEDVEGLLLEQDPAPSDINCASCDLPVDLSRGRFCSNCGSEVQAID